MQQWLQVAGIVARNRTGCFFVQFVSNTDSLCFSLFQLVLLSEDYGKHLLGVEDLLQKHSLVEADIAAQADRVQAVNEQAEAFLNMEPQEDGKQGQCVVSSQGNNVNCELCGVKHQVDNQMLMRLMECHGNNRKIADISSISPLSEQMTKDQCLKRQLFFHGKIQPQ